MTRRYQWMRKAHIGPLLVWANGKSVDDDFASFSLHWRGRILFWIRTGGRGWLPLGKWHYLFGGRIAYKIGDKI